MVTIVSYSPRLNLKGDEFFVLILQGGIEFKKSQTSDLHYATAMRCYVPSTFDEQTCESMLGQKLPGKIVRKPCEPFRHLDKNTGEEIEISHRYVYLPEGSNMEEVIYEGVPESAAFK